MPGPAVSSRYSFQQHHLIPVSVGRRPQIGHFLTGLHLAGFHTEDAATNLIALPADEGTAAASGAAMHRGPHPRYTAVVTARVERIRALHYRHRRGSGDAVARLHRLQRALEAVLASKAPRLIQLNRRDPMRLFADYSALDAAIDATMNPSPRLDPGPLAALHKVESGPGSSPGRRWNFTDAG